MNGFNQADNEFNKRYGAKTSFSLNKDDYEVLHSEAKRKLIKQLNGKPGKGIDVEIEKGEKKIPVEVTVLPSWKGDSFPSEEITIREDRIKKPHQQFAYFNAELNVVTVVTQSMLKKGDDGNYQVPKKSLEFHSI